MEKSWDKLLLIVVSVLVIGLSGWFITKALAFGDRFGLEKATPNDELPETQVARTEIARSFVDQTVEWKLPVRGDAPKEVPLFVSIPIVEIKGDLIDMLDPNAKLVREPVSNAWLMNNNLDFLNAGVLRQDADSDGFSNLEEWEKKTEPRDPESHPPYAEKLRMVSRMEKAYKLKFAARPDKERFQITRMPSASWPRRENFYMRVGDVSDDNQFRIDSFEEKSAQRNGITVDASVLNITYLPKNSKHVLVKDVEESIPTYFAKIDFILDSAAPEIVKEGDTFAVPKDPDTKYRVIEVKENSTTISYQTGSQPEQTVEIKMN